MVQRTAEHEALPTYQYKPLERDNHEIRLAILVHGSFDDELELHVIHRSFDYPARTPKRSMVGTQKLKRMVKHEENTAVRMNLEGRHVFVRANYGAAQVEASTYVAQDQDPNATSCSGLLEQEKCYGADHPVYDALSYTWGEPDPSIITFVLDEGCLRTSILAVGVNLACALRYLRHESEERALWIDAICINQKDISERNHQVKRMRQIYSRARNTIVWLGEPGQDTDHALSTIDYYANQVEYLLPQSFGDRPGAEHLDWWKSETKLPYNARTWMALESLFQKSWFTRTWVLQECQLSDERAIVQCGSKCIMWHSLRRAIVVMKGNSSVPPPLAAILVPYSIGLQSQWCRSLTRLLAWAKTRTCSDLRDKVYGVLSLTQTTFADTITPDYNAPFEEVYLDVFRKHIQASGTLDLVCQCLLSQKTHTSPSWLPNWSVTANGPVMDLFAVGPRRYASGHSAAHIRQLEPPLIEVLGKCCGRIIHLIDIGVKSGGQEFVSRACDESIRRHKQANIFADIAIKARRRQAYDIPNGNTFPFQYLAEMWQAQSALSGVAKDGLCGGSQLPTSLAICEDDEWCIAPLGTNSSDRIYILLGCELPMVLRPLQSGDYLVVGACLKLNIMNAEGLLGPLPQDWGLGINDVGLFQDFYNKITGERSRHDPRLPELPDEWEEVDQDLSSSFEIGFAFRNKVTDELHRSDPRLSPEELKARGIKLEWLRIL